jgi:hypothetical protein
MGTQTATLVSTICQTISDLRGETTSNTSASRIRAISRAETDFARRKLWRVYYIKDQTATATSGNDYTVGSATYPMRQKGLAEVFVDGTTEDKRHGIVDFNNFKRLYNEDNSYKIVYEWYDAANDLWKMHINPAPTAGVTITYSFFWEPPTRTLTTEKVICPNPMIVVKLAMADIADSEDDGDTANQLRQEVEQLIQELVSTEVMPAVNQLYGFSAIENAVRPKGIGSY